MIYVVIGVISFVLMFLFDVFTLLNRPYLKRIFGVTGLLLLLYATAKVILISDPIYFSKVVQIGASIFCVLFILLLVFSLFIEVSFTKTYGKQEHNNHLVDTGTYALCRHPGVLWFGLIYLFLFFATEAKLLIVAGVIWTLMDVLYILLQEKYIFKKMFPSYKCYQESTPMLIPNKLSLKRCMKTIIFNRNYKG